MRCLLEALQALEKVPKPLHLMRLKANGAQRNPQNCKQAI